jgi:uncharacterized protein
MIAVYKKFFLMLGVTVLLCLSASVVLSADFNKGVTAFERGDFTTALLEWKPLAEQGDALSQVNLGLMYDEGKGVAQDYKTAVKWYQLAAEQGDVRAQYNLGLKYSVGKGVTQDYKTSIKWYRLAVEQGSNIAQNNLGSMYFQGKGVVRDIIYAHMWWNISASNGNESARKKRDIIEKKMKPSDILTAQTLARECAEKKYKGC